MLQKKVCLLGGYGVGKTSLVRRYVQSIFWDIAGEDEVSTIRMSYLRGAAGYFLVVDVTRGATLEVAKSIQARVTAEIGPVPFLFLLNKTDLKEQWDIPEQSIEDLKHAGHV